MGKAGGPLPLRRAARVGWGEGLVVNVGFSRETSKESLSGKGPWSGCSGHPLHPVRGLELWVPHRGSVESQRFQLFCWNPHFQHDGGLVLWRYLKNPRKAAQVWGQDSALSLLLRQGKSGGEVGRTPGPLGRGREGEGLATNRHCKLWFKTIT